MPLTSTTYGATAHRRRTDASLEAIRSLVGHPRVYMHADIAPRKGQASLTIDKAYATFETQQGPFIFQRRDKDKDAAIEALHRLLEYRGCYDDGTIVAVGIPTGATATQPEGHGKPTCYSGILICLETASTKQSDISVAAKYLQTLAPLVANARDQDSLEELEIKDHTAQVFISRLGRLAQGEATVTPDTAEDVTQKSARRRLESIFQEAASFLQDWLGDYTEGCLILDAEEVQFVNAAAPLRRSKHHRHESASGQQLSYVQDSTSSSEDSSAQEKRFVGSLTTHHTEETASPSATRSSTGQWQQTSERQSDPLSSEAATGSSSTSSKLRSLPEVFIPTSSEGVVCSFPSAEHPIPLLASAGLEQSKVDSLPGKEMRRLVAQYFASARQSGNHSRCFFDDSAKEQSSNQLHLRRLLQLDSQGSVLCMASTDASLQPAFLIVVCLRERIQLREAEIMTLETISSALTYALLRARADIIDQTQLLFIGKVQHELRTPLHAIIGINEAVQYTLSASNKDLSSRHSEAALSPISDKDESQKSISDRSFAWISQGSGHGPSRGVSTDPVAEGSKQVAELIKMSESISSSADRLSSLVDDLVDFSILKRRDVEGGDIAPVEESFDSSPANGGEPRIVLDVPPIERELGIGGSRTWVSLETIFSVVSTTAERVWSSYRREGDPQTAALEKWHYPDDAQQPPLPELAFLVDPAYLARVGQRMMLGIDVEVLRRVVWKLVLNGLQATEKGIICVEVRHRILRVNTSTGVEEGIGEDEGEEKMAFGRLHRFEIKVEDTGKGISEDFLQKRIFQPYQKEDPDSSGVGLSLSLCKTMVERMSGRIHVSSQVGKGSSFTVVLPLHARSQEVSKTWELVHKTLRGTQLVQARMAFVGFKSYTLQMLKKKLIQQFASEEVDILRARNPADCEAILYIPSMELDELTDIVQNSSGPMPVFIELLSPHSSDPQDRLRTNALKRACQEKNRRMRVVKRPLTFARLLEINKMLRPFVDENQGRRTSAVSEQTSASSGGDAEDINDKLQAARDSLGKIAVRETNREISENVEVLAADVKQEAADVKQESRPPQHAAEPVPRDFKVLVVEDNPLNARILLTLLKRAKLTCLEARNGQEGLDVFCRELPAVVLLDINMPVMNGFDAAREMRAVDSPYSHYIIAVTALSSEADKIKGLECGIDEWFTKPLRMAPLVEELKRRKEAEHDTL